MYENNYHSWLLEGFSFTLLINNDGLTLITFILLYFINKSKNMLSSTTPSNHTFYG